MPIPKTFEESFASVKELAMRFGDNEAAYLSPKYQEAEVRQDFLDKFWISLGWDVHHEEHPNPYEREVKIEKSVMVGDRGKRADYAFYTTPNYHQARFLAEAKKPARQLENQYDCFQAIRYGWNSNTPIAVLTDFEEFIVLDSRYKPTVEKSLNGILEKFHYKEFADEETFRKLYFLFSREAVGNNSLEKFVEGLKKTKGKKAAKTSAAVQIQPVGDTFLTELDIHRENLARAFKRSNNELDGEELTEITQRTLDRLVFIRFLEDKLVEPSDIIDRLGKKTGNAWRDFANEIPRLNQIYNGIIFKPHSILDSPNFVPDNKTFDEVLAWLSHKNSAYDFNSIPIHILGSIYERFLGKTITVSDKRAKVEEKPEVRKAGGVYYTPEYIVRYIVENTIGKLIGGKSPNEIAKMRFADIACGSGSFLLGIFDHLIKYHVDWYDKSAIRNRKSAIDGGLCRETSDGSLQLTLEHKRDILLNNIYGVDLDAQAVEVAQLSLYLKLLEEETAATVQPKLAGLREQLLPNLNKNIVHGNSIIDYDIMDGQLFDSRELKKLNPMNFQSTFPEVFANGGFDAIVGNPPWGAELQTVATDYFGRVFSTGYSANSDSYVLFIERSLSLLKVDGVVGYITPDTFLRKRNHIRLRDLILEDYTVAELFETGPVFSQVRDTWCLVFSLLNRKPHNDHEVLHKQINRFVVSAKDRLEKFGKGLWDRESRVRQATWDRKFKRIVGYLVTDIEQRLIEKIENHGKLSEHLEYSISRGEEGSKFDIVESVDGDFSLLIPADVGRHSLLSGKRVDSKTLTQTKLDGLYQHPKIWIIRIQKMRWLQRLVCAFDERVDTAGMKTLQLIISRNDNARSLKFLTAILNSRLLNFYCVNYLADDMNQSYLEQLPIRTINFDDLKEKAAHDKIVELVEKMIEAKKNLASARTDSDKQFYERFCTTLDAQIDDLVYQLYDITAEERKIIEGV